jgi:DNA-binding transcriptional LysR family regulator
MNLNHLALFHAVAQEGSVGKGAELLHISQPAVSKQLAEFEKALGCRLFDRGSKGVRLTEAGLLLHTYSLRLFQIEREAERALHELQGIELGRLSLGASTSIGAYLLPSVLAQFHRAFPKIEISLIIGNTESVQKDLEEGRIDLGFTEGVLHSDSLHASIFHEDELVIIAAPHHPLVLETESVTIGRICREPFLVREPGSGTREVIEEALRSRQITLQPAMTLGNTEAIKRAVAEGTGVALVSRLTVRHEIRAGQLSIVPLSDFQLHRSLHQVQVRGRHLSPAGNAFLKTLHEAMPVPHATSGERVTGTSVGPSDVSPSRS